MRLDFWIIHDVLWVGFYCCYNVNLTYNRKLKQLNCVIRQFIGKEINSCGKTESIKHFQEAMINCSEE